MKRLAWPVILVCCLAVAGLAFDPPNATDRQHAIGPTNDLSPLLQRAFDPANDFQPIPQPGPNDWLATQKEPGQTVEQFIAADPNRPDEKHRKIYLQPLGDFPKDSSPSLDLLREFAAAYFGVPVEVAPPIKLAPEQFTTRINHGTGKRQWLTDDLLKFLQTHLPADAYCQLGVTMEDLYPAESWNFVFGEATLQERGGVYSFARYDPAFYGRPRDAKTAKLILQRSCKILGHETGHMFGMEHCIYFHCLMNGSNHLEETDAAPLHLCPVCLRKLQWSTNADLVARYQKLRDFYRKVGFDDEAAWTEKQLRFITGHS